MNRPTLRDVAREANLSVTQVSRALNDHDDVALTTKKLARRVAADLDYMPNLHARRLKDPERRSGTIGMILGNDSLRFSDPFFGDLLSAMVVEAATHDVRLQLSTTTGDSDPTAPYERAIRHRRVDGFVLLRTRVDDPRVDFLNECATPFVTFGRPINANGHALVDTVPDALGPAIAHLVDLGHRRIACLAEPPQFAIGAQRLTSFSAAVNDAAARVPLEQPQITVAGFREDDGFRAATALLNSADPPTAIIAVNDLLALGAMHAAKELGVNVPRQLSVVGFDDIGAASLVRPGLTTMRLSAADIGSMLIEELTVLIEAGSPSSRERYVAPTLIVRESTAEVPV